MADAHDPLRLTPPTRYLVRMLVFLVLTSFLVLVLAADLRRAFLANPGLNGLILGCLAVGIILSIWQVMRLFREVKWVNRLRQTTVDLTLTATPKLLSPIATLLGDKAGRAAISPVMLRSVLESVSMRLDETRDISRYLTGLLVFLGLLGTFWGLLETVGSVGGVVGALQSGKDTSLLFEDLKQGLQAPLAGMAVSFSSSLFGLAGSLILGFLDLQSGQAQTRFSNELEDWLSTTAEDVGAGPQTDVVAAALDRLHRTITGQAASGNSSAALASLAEGIQGLVQHMRAEQQIIRDWVEAQAEQQEEVKQLLRRIARENERG
jgi:hypothetical protein